MQTLPTATKYLGLTLMTLATLVGMVELPEKREAKVVVNSQPVFAFATDNRGAESASASRRERDESAPHYIGYSAFQRTPSRTGKF